MAVSRGSVDKVVREMCPGIDLDEESLIPPGEGVP